jgi:predicted negative regulator of RcsB-dependent stress response
MELAAKFQQLESTSYAELTAMIEAQTSVPREVFDLFLAKIYKRKK